MRKWYIAGILATALIITLGASGNFSSQPVKGPDEGFKNLKILPKNISDDALDSIMTEYRISLGVRCGFCHARKKDTTQRGLDFASDEKEEKNTAREMMKMTAYLNENFFNDNHSTRPDTIHAIVCYTCHRGGHEPDAEVFLKRIDSIEVEQRKRQKAGK